MAPVTPDGRPAYYARGTHSWWMLLFAAVLLIIAAFSASGDSLGDIATWTWGFAGFAAVVLAWVVP